MTHNRMHLNYSSEFVSRALNTSVKKEDMRVISNINRGKFDLLLDLLLSTRLDDKIGILIFDT